MTAIKNDYELKLKYLRRKYNTTRNHLQHMEAVYAEMLKEQSVDTNYFKYRVDAMKSEMKGMEEKYLKLGGNLSNLG